MKRLIFLILFVFCAVPVFATTWYVNSTGGTRYSVNQTNGQCNGMSPAPYPGSGVNQNCAFGDIRYLWADGSYTGGSSFPGWGWIGSGGDTYLIDCPNDCRVGYSGPNDGTGDFFLGIAGDPYDSGAPVPISGTPTAHTKILGLNYAACTSDSAKAHINGGYGVQSVFNLIGASYVDLACLNITDHSNCGRSGQANGCSKNFPMSDYALNGIITNNTASNISLTDVRIHGMAAGGIGGATGTGWVINRLALVGNASSGWNMDDGSGTTGNGTLTINGMTILWAGCAEQYPNIYPAANSIGDCTDDDNGGYGDCLGTATVPSSPAWTINITNSTAAYCTQDGFDLLHLNGPGTSLTITNSLAYSNMGQQLKMGAAGTATNNLLVGNCNALRQSGIPGTTSNFNAKLSDFCRAADTAVAIAVQDSTTTDYEFNTLYSANATGVEIDCGSGLTCTNLSTIIYRNNIFLGFLGNLTNGYPSGGSGDYSNPIFYSVAGLFSDAGSIFDHNETYHPKSNWPCPNVSLNETNAHCTDPGLTDETWHLYGLGTMSPLEGSPVARSGSCDPRNH